MNSLQQLVETAPALFSGAVRESEESLHALEKSLGITLPSDVRWFWSSCGSGQSHAAPSASTSVSDTLRYRAAVELPLNYIVLDDRNDAGTVLLDIEPADGRVIWVDSHAVGKVALGTLSSSEHELFPSFMAWVSCCMQDASDAA